ncbi:hypothetical protein PMAYCL1PPCAC_21422, partial [Pristionchus mayeri]
SLHFMTRTRSRFLTNLMRFLTPFSIILFTSASGYNITLFSLPNRRGNRADFVSDSCENIAESFVYFDGGVSAVCLKDTSLGTNCIIMHSDAHCEGFRLIMRPGTMHHNNLEEVGFDNRAKLIGPCELIRVDGGTTTHSEEIMPFILCTLLTAMNAIIFSAYLLDKKYSKEPEPPRTALVSKSTEDRV